MAPASMAASVICTSIVNFRTSEMCHCKWEFFQVVNPATRKCVGMEPVMLPANQALPASVKEDGLDPFAISKPMTLVLEISMSFFKIEL